MKTQRIFSLQTMRLFASLGVVQYHLWHNYLGISIGHPGTDFFLVLVGVVAAYTQAKRIPQQGFWPYMKSRYIRLYVTFTPLFLIALFVKRNEANFDWVIRSFLFIPIPNRSPIIGCTWMLSMFMLFYFLFGISFLVKTEQILWPIFGLWAALILAYSWLNWQPDIPGHWANIILAERNLDFIMGYVVGTILRKQRLKLNWARGLLWTGLIGIIIGTSLLNLGLNSPGRAFLLGLPVAVFVLGLADIELQTVPSSIVKALTAPWLVWLGGTSYVLYLSHGMFFQIWSRLLPISPILVPIVTLGAITVGILGYVFWEKPILKYIKHQKWEYPSTRSFLLVLRNLVSKKAKAKTT